MRVLVTGGAGYIGSTLAPMLLEQNHQVTVLDNLLYGGESMLGFWAHPKFSFVQGDVQDRQENIDAVVHLAAIVGDPACQQAPEIAKSTNVDGSLFLFNKSRESHVNRFIFASTCSNYGRMSDPTQYVDEASNLQPVSLYAETKVHVERTILDSPDYPDFYPTVVRFATVFGVGARMRFDLTVNEFTAEMLLKKHLVVFGEQFWRPYIHVRDAAHAIIMLLNAEPGKNKS
jgi:nucleoside-diphosphate-sugar epimerase